MTAANCTAGTFAGGTVQFGPAVLGASGPVFGNPTQGAQAGDRALGAASNEQLCFVAALPLSTGNAFQAATTTVSFTFDAEQTKNNP